jgi:hypothetical protein
VLLLPLNPAESASNRSLEVITGHVDARRLRAHADSLHVPRSPVYGIAWQESRDGSKGNKVLGVGIVKVTVDTVFRAWGVDGKLDSVKVVYHTKHICKEIGRMQLNPCVNWTQLLADQRCSLKRVTISYDDNVHCGILNIKRCAHTQGWAKFASCYNGGNMKYQKEVEQYLGHLVLREIR